MDAFKKNQWPKEVATNHRSTDSFRFGFLPGPESPSQTKTRSTTMVVSDHLLALAPLVPPLSLMIPSILTILTKKQEELDESQQEQQLQLIAFLVMAVIGFLLTNSLVPTIRQYTGRQGISGKDLGKKGTPLEDKNV